MTDRQAAYKTANLLALITIFYNLAEGIVSVVFGIQDETIALFGFGIDSFVEVISGIGIWHMIRRVTANHDESPDRFERAALKTTGTAFYLLSAGLLATALIDLWYGKRPETTLWGIIISVVSITTMWLLYSSKVKIGKKLNSEAIIADAHCTRACIYLSIALLIASVGYEVTGIGGLDALGAIAIAIISFNEGRESFEKARGKACSCGK